MLQEKLTDGKHQPVIVRMYEELQEKSTAMLVNVEPDPADKEFEDVRIRSICNFFLQYQLGNMHHQILWTYNKEICDISVLRINVFISELTTF